MSYDEVAGLLERVTGAHVLSDQTIQHLVVTKATQVSAQWQAEVQADPDASALLDVVSQVDWYDAHSDEVLVLTDAIQVKQQKARRGKGADNPEEEQTRKRVNTDVWLVERATGGFEYLTAGIAAPDEEVVSATARVRRQLQQDYNGREAPLPVVVISDGAKTIRCQLAALFGQPVPLILDWFHLVRQEVACVIVRHDANRDRTWCPITSTLGGEIGR